ncbi:MAG: hypothetical protein JAY91_06000, partial [Candidatus Thiodiazotropha endolucinida]|nr:hypothetical protein [Candidatus Thiodiazotropha taylori]MCW4240428.1 hypothetical protein [Candidatus Thiodiazotropha taylori]
QVEIHSNRWAAKPYGLIDISSRRSLNLNRQPNNRLTANDSPTLYSSGTIQRLQANSKLITN